MIPRRILVAVDFSYHAQNALRLALSLANRWRSTLTALHVDPLPGIGTVAVEPIYVPPQMFQGLHVEHDAEVEKQLRAILAELQAEALPGVSVNVVLRRQGPVEGIIGYAAEWQADLIIMGSQGASGMTQLLLGSTAEKVSRAAPCPVLVAGRADDDGERERRFRRVLAAVDYSEFSEPVARLAAAFVEPGSPGGLVEFLHVWSQPYVTAFSTTMGGERGELAQLIEGAREAEARRLEEFCASLGMTGPEFTRYIDSGSPPAKILQRAQESGAELLVLGAHSRKGIRERLIGTVADRVLRHAQVPVLVYPEGALQRGLR